MSFDLVVIGAGPAGMSGAATASRFGFRVALLEREREIGGAGLNTGTVPSKTLRETALALSGWRSRRLFGVDLSLRREASVADFTRHSATVTGTERRRMESILQRFHVERFHGTARFEDPHTIGVIGADGSRTTVRGERVLIATGSSPVRPSEFPFDDPRVHDSDEILSLGALPKRLIVVGAGVIGSEYACTFSAIGAEVHLVDGRDTLLPFLDEEISTILATAMAGDGIRFHWGARVTACDVSASRAVRVALSSGARLEADGVLVCAGRSSNTGELNLAAAGIAPGPRGLIPVDARFRTRVPHIYAAGDVIGAPALAATGMEQARVAACDALGIVGKEDLAPLLPTGIYTIPEASMVGATERSLREKGIDYVVGRARYADTARGRIIGEESGILKLLFRRDDLRLLGVHVAGEHATDLVHVGMMVLLSGRGAELLNGACFNYPTLGDLYKHATYDAILQMRGAGAMSPASSDRSPGTR